MEISGYEAAYVFYKAKITSDGIDNVLYFHAFVH